MPPVGGCCCAELAAAPSFAVRLAAPEGRPLWNTAKAELTKLSSSAAAGSPEAGSAAAGSEAAGSEAAGSSSSLLLPLSWAGWRRRRGMVLSCERSVKRRSYEVKRVAVARRSRPGRVERSRARS